ncbi:MAG: hypothetical protein DRI73_04745 [Bacteroidetes bacterium]|nr:MAG: hypothetical protein DRI73_04745 [Bacteroidota bacterium]
MSNTLNNKKILVLGGGFGGIETAIKLRKYGYTVNLISARDYLFVYPISIWIPVNKKKFNDVKIDLSILEKKHGFHAFIETITKIDIENKIVLTDKSKHEYDYLFIAMGMGKVSIKGMEHTHSICGNPDESIVIKEELEKLIQQGHGKIAVGFSGNPKDPTATAVRGGPAFELMFNFSHYLKKKKLRDNFDLTFFAPMAEPGKKMGKKAYSKMDIFFKHYKVHTSFGKKI